MTTTSKSRSGRGPAAVVDPISSNNPPCFKSLTRCVNASGAAVLEVRMSVYETPPCPENSTNFKRRSTPPLIHDGAFVASATLMLSAHIEALFLQSKVGNRPWLRHCHIWVTQSHPSTLSRKGLEPRVRRGRQFLRSSCNSR